MIWMFEMSLKSRKLFLARVEYECKNQYNYIYIHIVFVVK